MVVSSVSAHALRLMGAGARGAVHSVFGTSFNVELDGNLIHIGSTAVPLSCLGAAVRAEEMPRLIRRVEVGDEAVWDAGSLELRIPERSVVLAMGGAPVVDLAVPRAGAWPQGMDEALIAALGPLDLTSRIGLPWEGEERSSEALENLARFSALCLARELGEADPVREESAVRAMRSAVSYLVGRGLGLTPSGDDVLCGFGCGLAFLYGREGLSRMFLDVVAAEVPGKTTAVSEAYLKAMRAGCANADYIDLCAALEAREVSMLPGRLARVLEMGHTSGADGLLGFAAAFCCLI